MHLRPGLPEEAYVAGAICNLTAFELGRARGESMVWQVLRVQGSAGYHYRLVMRARTRLLDWGLSRDAKRILEEVSNRSVDELRIRFDSALTQGMKPVAIREVAEDVDYWRDEFWNLFSGDPAG